MNRERLESEISRLATEESKIVELQKHLDKKSESWKALEVKRIEYSVQLAIHSIRLADIISGTKRCGRLYGEEYTADSNPIHFIRLGLRKANIYPADNPKPTVKSVSSGFASGCVKLIAIGFAVAFVISILVAIFG